MSGKVPASGKVPPQSTVADAIRLVRIIRTNQEQLDDHFSFATAPRTQPRGALGRQSRTIHIALCIAPNCRESSVNTGKTKEIAASGAT
jgi:hypothetical protein